jgi:hypothetical protein
MNRFHAVIWLDHQQAQVVHFDATESQAQTVRSHHHPTAQHGSEVRAVHEFFGHVCDALQGTPEVLVTGGRTTLADFRHYVEKHRAALGPHVMGWEVVDHPTPAQLVALARQRFVALDRMAGTPTPS